jgi:hypothetical protein
VQTQGDYYVPRTSSSGISAWLFIGSNSSFPGKDAGGKDYYGLDIGDIPASYNETFHWTISEPKDLSTPSFMGAGAPLASVLLCDPKQELSSAYVTFSPATGNISILPEAPKSRVGNISPGSAAVVLMQSLLDATAIPSYTQDPRLSITSSSLFLQKSPAPLNHDSPTKYIKSAANISSTIGPYVSSATKAWSDGFYRPGHFSTMVFDAIQDDPTLALIGSRPLTITTGILILIILGLAVAQLWLPVGESLGIASIIKASKSQKQKP